MKIGYFVESYKRGGVDTFIKNLLSKKGHNDIFCLIYNNDNPGINYIKKNCKNIIYLKYSIFAWDKIFDKKINNYFLIILKIIYSLLFPITFIYQILKLLSFFKRYNFDKLMIINGGYPGGDICLAACIAWSQLNPAKKPWINFHNFALKRYKNFLLNIYKNLIDKFIKRSVKGFVSVSKICSSSIKFRKNLKNVKVLTIYNGHYLKKNRNRFLYKKKFNLPTNSKILLMLAEYDLRKGHKYIIDVMEEINQEDKNIFLFIFGHGDSYEINKLVKKSSSSNNIFLNKFNENNFGLISSCDLLVIPSQKYESFGYTAIEAMSLKKPVISTNCGGLREVIEDNITGYLVDRNKPKLFAKKVLNLLSNTKLKKKMGNKSFYRYKKHFTHTKMIKSYNNLIKYNRI